MVKTLKCNSSRRVSLYKISLKNSIRSHLQKRQMESVYLARFCSKLIPVHIILRKVFLAQEELLKPKKPARELMNAIAEVEKFVIDHGLTCAADSPIDVLDIDTYKTAAEELLNEFIADTLNETNPEWSAVRNTVKMIIDHETSHGEPQEAKLDSSDSIGSGYSDTGFEDESGVVDK